MTNKLDDDSLMFKLTEAYLRDGAMRQLEVYVRGDRYLKDKSTTELTERWIVLFREMTNLDNSNEAEREAVEAEMSLRNVTLPVDQMKDELKAFMNRIDAGFRELKRDPERLKDAEEDFMSRFQAFRNTLDKEPN